MLELADGQFTGRTLGGRYRLVNQIDKGGMGAVYEAVQEGLGRRVAVKLLHPHLARDTTLLERFRREADMAGGLGHPNIVQITDFQALPGEPAIIVMEYLIGTPLSKILSGGRTIDQARLVNIAIQVCAGLAAAHAAGIVHRDLKPPNIFVTELAGGAEVVKLLDFGIAKLKESAAYSRLTKTGVLVGTPQFMAPEQAQGEDVDGRADLWALGVCMYRALTGTLPFQGDSPADLWKAILGGSPVPIETYRPEIDSDLAAIVRRVLSPDRTKRFASAVEMQQALSAISMRPSLVAPIPATVASLAVSGAAGAPAARISAVPAPRASGVPPRASSAPTHVRASAPRVSGPGPTGRTSASPARSTRVWLIPLLVVGILAVLVVLAAVALFALGMGARLGVRPPPATTSPAPVAQTPALPASPSATVAPSPSPSPSPTRPESPDVKPPVTDEERGSSTGTLVPSLSPTAPQLPSTVAPGQSGLVPSAPSGTTTLLAPTTTPSAVTGRLALSVQSVIVDDLYRHDDVRIALAPMLPSIAVCFELASATPSEIAEYRWRASVAADGTVSELLPTGSRSAVDSLASCMSAQRQQIRLGPTRTRQAGTIILRFTAQ